MTWLWSREWDLSQMSGPTFQAAREIILLSPPLRINQKKIQMSLPVTWTEKVTPTSHRKNRHLFPQTWKMKHHLLNHTGWYNCHDSFSLYGEFSSQTLPLAIAYSHPLIALHLALKSVLSALPHSACLLWILSVENIRSWKRLEQEPGKKICMKFFMIPHTPFKTTTHIASQQKRKCRKCFHS